MPSIGYIQVRAYESYAQLPLENVAIVITAVDGTAIAMRLTDRNGQIVPIEIPVPDRAESQTPNPTERPYATVNLYAHLRSYEQVEIENMQVFADTTTTQDLMLIPLSELPGSWNQTAIFNTPAQNL